MITCLSGAGTKTSGIGTKSTEPDSRDLGIGTEKKVVQQHAISTFQGFLQGPKTTIKHKF